MATGKTGVVGRVAVKVTPDLDGFYEKTKADLEAIGKRLGDLEINVKLVGLEREVKKLQAQMDRITDISIEVNVDLDQADVERVEDKLDDIGDGAKARIEVQLAQASYRIAQGSLARLARSRFVDYIPRVNKAAAAQVAAALSALSGLRGLGNVFDKFSNWLKNLDKTAPIIGSLVAAVMGLSGWLATAASNAFALSRDLALIAPAALALPGILGGVVIGVGATVAVFKDFNEVLPEVGERFSELQDKMSETFWKEAKAPIEDMINRLFPEFEAGLIRTSQSLATFYGGLADALGSALDGALVGMFDDLNESIDIAATGAEAFANIIKVLGEAGASYLPRLAKWFVGISESFSAWLSEVQADGRLHEWIDQGIQMMKDLGRVISEASGILSGLARAAAEAGGSSLASFADTLGRIHKTIDSPAFQTGFTNFLRNSHELMSQIADISGKAMLNSFASMGKLTDSLFPSIGRGLGILAKSFAQVLDNPKFQSGLVSMMDGFTEFAGHLSGTVAKVAPALGALMSLIGTLASNLGQVLAPAIETLADVFLILAPPIEEVISALGGQLTSIIRALSPVFTEAAKALVPMVESFAAFARDVGPKVQAVLVPLVEGFSNLALTGVAMLVGALEPLMPLLGQAAEALGGALPEAAWLLLPPLTDLAGILMESLLVAITEITPYIPQVADGFARILDAVIPLIDPTSSLATSILPLLMTIFEGLVQKIETLAPYIDRVLEAFQRLVDFIMPVLVPAIEGLMNVLNFLLEGFIDGVVQAFEGLTNTIIGIWETFAGIFTGDWERAWEGIKQVASGIWDTISGIAKAWLFSKIGGILKGGLTLIRSLWSKGWTAVKTFGSTVWNTIRSLWDTAIHKISTICATVMDTIKSTWNEKWTAIKNWASTTWESIKSTVTEKINSVKSTISSKMSEIKTNITTKWTEIKTTIQNKWNEITSWIKTKWEAFVLDVQGFWAKVKDKFKKGMDDAKTQVENGFNTLKTWFTELPGKIKGWLGDLGSTLLQAGKDLIQGFIDGIGSMFSSVKSKLGSLTSSLTSWKGPPKKDKKLLTSAGHMVIQGFIDGLEDRFEDVRKLLQSLTEEIEGTSIMAPTVEPFEVVDVKRQHRAWSKQSVALYDPRNVGKTFNYYAAPNNSLEAQEELFEAMNRGRAVGW